MQAVVRAESWPIRGGFRIARGARSTAEVLVVELYDGGAVGRGECVPYARYGESLDSVGALLEATTKGLERSAAAEHIAALPAGAARNALDCALWDLRGKLAGAPVWKLAGLGSAAAAVSTMRTVSVDSPEAMAKVARGLLHARVIKVKVDGGPDLERLAAVHAAAPSARLVVDANESWSIEQTRAWLPALPELGVAVLEQPLPAGADDALRSLDRAVPICADESFHDRGSLSEIRGGYDLVNVKLDKAGGLTEALACVREARNQGLPFMVGCMVSSSLAIEPALLLAGGAAYVDLDGALLLESDREGARHERETGLIRPSPSIWGGG